MTDHGFHYLLPIAALALGACGEAPAAPEAPAAVMVGQWQYARAVRAVAAPAISAGLFVTFVIDSAGGNAFTGRVTSWFVGDTDISIERFGPVSGTIDEASEVTLTIPVRSATAPYTVIGLIADDEIIVMQSWNGPNAGPIPVGGRFQRLH